VVDVHWAEVGHALVVPSLSFKTDYIVAVLGTTISPYLFFWQAGEEVEDEEERPEAKPLKQAPATSAGGNFAHPHRPLSWHGAV
jgi:Mn2+/Fe2+ NRAMP family transporter